MTDRDYITDEDDFNNPAWGASMTQYVVTFAKNDDTKGLRRMSLVEAQKLVSWAAPYRTGRILEASDND